MNQQLIFAISAMHAYAHHWACQLVFNPRMKPGYGLSDGEGVERLWSRLRGFIGILRHVSVRLKCFNILKPNLLSSASATYYHVGPTAYVDCSEHP